MPLLTLLGGAAALAAGVLGVGGHLDAQDKNEEAEKRGRWRRAIMMPQKTCWIIPVRKPKKLLLIWVRPSRPCWKTRWSGLSVALKN